jgi:acyl-CoA hydrolase
MAPSILSEHLRPGDLVVVGQATGEPVGLVADLFDCASRLGPVEVFCGLSLNPAWEGDVPDALRVTTYCGLGSIRRMVAGNRARVVPASLSQLSSRIAAGAFRADVVLLQVSPADADGYHSTGFSMDYVCEALQTARVVVVEVNTNLPITRGAGRLHQSAIVVARNSDAPLLEAVAEVPSELQRQIARRVTNMIPDGATVQLGIGGLAAAVAQALTGRRELKIRSGMVGDWFVDLIESGALDTTTSGGCQTSLAVGSGRLYTLLSTQGILEFALPSQLVIPIPDSPFVAVNSAIEVDLRGQVNAEFLGQRYVGAAGGQTDYFRAARRSAGGLAIVALPSVSGKGTSRIVPSCAYVTSAQSDVDFIVTENGAVDIRAITLDERRALIAGLAVPIHRDALLGQDT